MQRQVSYSAIIFLFVFFFSNTTASNEQQVIAKGWKAGVARVMITPQDSIWMQGYLRKNPSEGALIDLWAKALAIEDAKGEHAVLVTMDLIGLDKYNSDRIRDRVKAKYGLSRAQIILNSSHTHTGPVLQGDPEDCMLKTDMTEEYSDMQRKIIIEYTRRLEDHIVTLVGKALHSMSPADLYAQNGITRFQVNRRNNNESKLTPQSELKGPNDYAVPVIKVVNGSGDLIAIVFGYACHATALGINLLSGDYPGYAQLELEKLHPDVTAMFFQGAGADQNPLPRKKVALAQQYGRELAAAVEAVLSDDMRKLSPHLSSSYSEVELQFANPLPNKDDLLLILGETSGYPSYLKREAKILLNKLEQGKSLIKSYPYPLQVWKLGEQLMVSLGGEPVIDYTIKLKQLFGQDIFVSGYNNDLMSYIPSARVLKEGGYEGSRSAIFTTPWASDIETVIINEVIKLAKQVGAAKPI